MYDVSEDENRLIKFILNLKGIVNGMCAKCGYYI